MTDDDLTACADIVRRADPERFLAAMAAPVATRGVLFPLYAFNAEVARAPWVTAETVIAEMRLQWWRDALEEIRAGRNVRRHAVTTPLARVLDAEGAALLDALIAARRQDIYGDPFTDHAALDDYLVKTAGYLMWVAARALGASPAARDPVLAAGFAHGVGNWLRAVPALEAAGRRPLPDDDPAPLRRLAEEARARLALARRERARIGRAASAALLPAWQTNVFLRRAARDPGLVRAGGLEISPLRGRLMLMARAATGRW